MKFLCTQPNTSITMEFQTARYVLELREPFTISRGTKKKKQIILLRISDGEYVGVGAASPAKYLNDSVKLVEQELPDLLNVVRRKGVGPGFTNSVNLDSSSPSACAAVSIAVHDLVAKKHEDPLYEYLGLSPSGGTTTSYTIGAGSIDAVKRRAERVTEEGYDTIKIKVGNGSDIEKVRAVRDIAPEASIRVDANGGWSAEEAVENLEVLAELGVEFVEQPVMDDLGYVYRNTSLPIAVDESCVISDDVEDVADVADIVVVKLMKCGGVQEALQTINTAHQQGLESMIGCMVESNASIAAAAHLTPKTKYQDLDGSLLVDNDPYKGVPMPEGDIDLENVNNGTGARRIKA